VQIFHFSIRLFTMMTTMATVKIQSGLRDYVMKAGAHRAAGRQVN
jgi:hypothetical protein